jgi:hypothetical protein
MQLHARPILKMVALGHPFADDYMKFRAYFDGLAYACNSGARFVAYRNEHHHVEYWGPSLGLSKDGIWPSDQEAYHGLARKAAEDGWPEECKPSINPGSFCLTTKSVRFAAEVFVLSKGLISLERLHKSDPKSPFHVYNVHFDVEGTRAMIKLIEKYMGKWILPRRTWEHNIAGRRPLPLAEKQLNYTHVEHVTVTEREVQVPKIPLDGSSGRVVSNTWRALCSLAMMGYPFERVREYGERWIKKGVIRDVEREVKRLDRGRRKPVIMEV